MSADNISKYLVVKQEILEIIKDGTELRGGRLPSEDKLADMLKVSRTTVRSALQSLADENVIVKKHGLGNFVQPERHPMSSTLSFDKAAHIPLGDSAYGEVVIQVEKCDAKAAQILNIKQGAEIVVIKKAMSSNGAKSAQITEHFPKSIIADLPDNGKIPNSIYEFAEKYCHASITKVVSEVLPISAVESPFGRENGPCLKFEEVFFSETGSKIAFSDLYMNTNIIHPQFIRS